MQHHSAGRLFEAEGICQQILQADPNQPDALHLLGLIAYQFGKNDTAADLIDQALATRPDYAEAYSNRGNALQGLKQLDEAVASYDKAISIKPGYAEATGINHLPFYFVANLEMVGSFINGVGDAPKSILCREISRNRFGRAGPSTARQFWYGASRASAMRRCSPA